MIQYRPSVGDPHFVGWLTTFLYLIAAVLFWFTYIQPNFSHTKTTKTAKYLLTISMFLILLLLAVNKQLDLQNLLRDIGREISLYQGWFDSRRWFQQWFVGILASIGIGAVIGFGYLMREEFIHKWLLFLGVLLITGFIVFRASQFHHFEITLPWQIFATKNAWFLELFGILCIILQTLLDRRKQILNSNK